MRIIERGNYFRKTYSMDEDTTIRGGNFVLCEVTTNGHTLTIEGGNVRGLYIDGLKQDDYVWQRYEALPIAEKILEDATQKGGEDGKQAWLYGFVEQVLNASPTVPYSAVEPAYVTWQEANNNFVTFTILYDFILTYLPDGWGWSELRDYIRQYDLATWEGGTTQLVEEYS